MLFGILLCISFSKAELLLAKDGRCFILEEFPLYNDILSVTSADFRGKFGPEERYYLYLLESGELTELVDIKFRYVKNEENKCNLLECLDVVKNAHDKGNKIVELSVYAVDLFQDHLNIIKELSSN